MYLGSQGRCPSARRTACTLRFSCRGWHVPAELLLSLRPDPSGPALALQDQTDKAVTLQETTRARAGLGLIEGRRGVRGAAGTPDRKRNGIPAVLARTDERRMIGQHRHRRLEAPLFDPLEDGARQAPVEVLDAQE